MDIGTRRALAQLDAWLEDRLGEPLKKSEVEWIVNHIANKYCTGRKSFDEISEALNKHMLGMV